MTADQRAAWRKAQADLNRARRNQRGKRKPAQYAAGMNTRQPQKGSGMTEPVTFPLPPKWHGDDYAERRLAEIRERHQPGASHAADDVLWLAEHVDWLLSQRPQVTATARAGPAQHTHTRICDGFHLPGPCPPGRGVLTATGGGPLLDDACRAGDCGSCGGPPCEHSCHQQASP